MRNVADWAAVWWSQAAARTTFCFPLIFRPSANTDSDSRWRLPRPRTEYFCKVQNIFFPTFQLILRLGENTESNCLISAGRNEFKCQAPNRGRREICEKNHPSSANKSVKSATFTKTTHTSSVNEMSYLVLKECRRKTKILTIKKIFAN